MNSIILILVIWFLFKVFQIFVSSATQNTKNNYRSQKPANNYYNTQNRTSNKTLNTNYNVKNKNDKIVNDFKNIADMFGISNNEHSNHPMDERTDNNEALNRELFGSNDGFKKAKGNSFEGWDEYTSLNNVDEVVRLERERMRYINRKFNEDVIRQHVENRKLMAEAKRIDR